VARCKKITTDVLGRVPAFIEQGLTASNIADAIGCTVGTLRVKCSQMGISLRQKSPGNAAVANNPFSGRGACTSPSSFLTSPSSFLKASHSKRPGHTPSVRHAVITLDLPQTVVVRLRERAALKGLSTTTFVSMLLEIVVRDCLYDAVLDDQDELDHSTIQRGL
jgi:hypothetical protein